MRVLAGGAVAVVVWLVVAAEVPSHPPLRLADVVPGAVITQPFGCTSVALEPFDDLCLYHHRHTGIDLAAGVGTEVHSATYGRAVTGFDPAGCGNFVIVAVDTHVRLLYCHLSAFRVTSGASVEPSQVIALVGSTGLSTGPHVHFQVDVDGEPIDPASWLGPSPEN